ncbi:MAG: hypothetical protein LBV21_05265 [Candidatus Adiutrix sp.]|jgi:hypothetical protein|nr:hypothetical protein [Candidatus Adiutrix sp.]
MRLKKNLPALTLILALALPAGLALAQTATETRKEAAAPARELSPADYEARDALWAEHRRKVEPLRDQLWAKELEYEALTRGGDANRAEVKVLIDDMVKLKGLIRAEREKLFSQTKARGFFGPGQHFYSGCGGPGGWDHDKRPQRGGFGHHGRR